jgi:anti-anti-sigma factor
MPDQFFESEVESFGDGVVVRLRGAAGLPAQSELERLATRVLSGRPKRVVVDARELSFIASFALGQLVSIARRVQSDGGEVIVGGAADPVTEVFERSRLGGLMTMVGATRLEEILRDIGTA